MHKVRNTEKSHTLIYLDNAFVNYLTMHTEISMSTCTRIKTKPEMNFRMRFIFRNKEMKHLNQPHLAG